MRSKNTMTTFHGDLSGEEEFRILPKDNKATKFLTLRCAGLFGFDPPNVKVAVLINRRKHIAYYHVIYKNNGNPQEIYLLNTSGKALTLNCGIGCIPFESGSMTSMGGFGKLGYEGYLAQIGIQMPWKWKKEDQEHVQEDEKEEKQCGHCKIKRSKTVQLRLCSRCKQTRYCSRECQKKSWKQSHRYLCESTK